MKADDLSGGTRRLVYIEMKDGDIDGASARIGWVTVVAGGLSVFYRGRTLRRLRGDETRGSTFDDGSGHQYWISRIKKRGTHAHFAERVAVRIDPDARYEYRRIRALPSDQVRR